MKYKYIGVDPVLVIEHNIEVKQDDVIEVETPLNSVFFVLVEEDSKKKTKEEVVK